MDGRGERATTSYGIYQDRRYRRLKQVNLPHSLGLLYEAVTDYLGFLHSSDEYKVMALASYGKPVYADAVPRDRCSIGATAITKCGPRNGQNCSARHASAAREFDATTTMNIARSLQIVLEETVLKMARWLHEETGAENLAMAGGVALNCVMNARVRDQRAVQATSGCSRRPAMPARRSARRCGSMRQQRGMCEAAAAGRWSMRFSARLTTMPRSRPSCNRPKLPLPRAPTIVGRRRPRCWLQNKVIGWFQGRMEFGPRALGARSILASPLDAAMQARLNQIKDREDFRPVAPVVLEEAAADWFAGGRRVAVHAVRVRRAGRQGRPHSGGAPRRRHRARSRPSTARRIRAYYDLLQAFARAHRRAGAGQYLVQYARRAGRVHAARRG